MREQLNVKNLNEIIRTQQQAITAARTQAQQLQLLRAGDEVIVREIEEQLKDVQKESERKIAEMKSEYGAKAAFLEPLGSLNSNSQSTHLSTRYHDSPRDHYSQSKTIVMLFQRLLVEQRQEIIKLQHRVDQLNKTSLEELQQQL